MFSPDGNSSLSLGVVCPNGEMFCVEEGVYKFIVKGRKLLTIEAEALARC